MSMHVCCAHARARGGVGTRQQGCRLVKMSGRDDEVGPSGLSVKEMDITDCPVHSVVVYQDRAEVSQQAC